MNITEFSQYLEKLDDTASRNDMTELLAELFNKADDREIDKICYLSLGRLSPKFEAVEFQMSTKSMLKVITRAYDEDGDLVKKLFKEKGDLGSVVVQLAGRNSNKKVHQGGPLQVSQVYETLLSIAQEEGSGSVERKVEGFSELLKTLDPISAKYITRIPIGDLRLGFSDMTIIDALSWMKTGDKSLRKIIEHAYNVSADIGLIAKTFKEKGEQGIAHHVATPGIPIRPQQAERSATAEDMISKVETAAVEWKLDGLRAQIHVLSKDQRIKRSRDHKKQLELGKYDSDREVQIFSRSLENTTAMFPEIVQEFQKLKVTSVILDGEAIGYDPKTGKNLPFQETIQRKRKHGISTVAKLIPLRYYAFDILSLDGMSYLTKPFCERRKALETLFSQNKDTISSQTVTIADQIITKDAIVLDEQFDESVKKGFEGIMVKKNDALYQAGARNFNWIKFKHHGEGKLSDTLDCVVMGYYAGKGKRSGFGIGAFLVGVLNRHHSSSVNRRTQDDTSFVTVAKIGTGLTDEQWKEMKMRSKKLEVKNKPDEYDVPKELFPDVWVKPGIVVEVAADELTKSPMHTAGLALRFPRLVNFRDDKSPHEATTTREVKKLYTLQK